MKLQEEMRLLEEEEAKRSPNKDLPIDGLLAAQGPTAYEALAQAQGGMPGMGAGSMSGNAMMGGNYG